MIDRFLRRPTGIEDAIPRLGKYAYPPSVLTRLDSYLRTAPAPDLAHLDPAALSQALQLDEATTLELLVAAVHEGLCDLYWEAHCIHCNGLNKEWSALSNADPHTYCTMCKVDSTTTMDSNMQIRFALHRRYRVTRRGLADAGRAPTALAPREARLTGLDLLNVQVFRDLLADQVLPANESLAVTRLALLFSDLRGSTAFYARKGDPVAYRLVREHYTVIGREVRAVRGAVVKTVGDGVMASFGEPLAALRAALAIQAGLAAFNRDHHLTGDDALLLKLGVHTGPCLSVNLNGRMDYFGTTVNVASRIEGLSQGADVVVTAPVLAESGAAALLDNARRQGATVTEFVSTLRGIDAPVQVARIALPAPALAESPTLATA